MLADSSSKSHNIQFFTYVVFCVSFMALSINYPQVNASFQSFVVDVSTPILRIVQKPSEWAEVIGSSVSGHVSVYEENKQLKQELDETQNMNRTLAIVQHENSELRSLLDMVFETAGEPIAAHVISDKKSAFNHTVIVNVGEPQGVEKGQVVISKNGVVGRVLEAFENASRILLLTDNASRIPIKILDANVRGIVKGTNSYNLELIFTEDARAKLKEDMIVVTTGAGGVFLADIPVGVIEKVGKRVYIKPYVDFDNLDIISIQRQKMLGVL